jgi:hypothetical protein
MHEKIMKIKFQSLLIIFVLCFALTGNCQIKPIPIGTWQSHFNYAKGKSFAQVGDKIYAVADIGLFVYDISDNEAKILNISDGFYDLNISEMAFHPATKTLVLAYISGAIDLAKIDSDGEIVSFTNILSIKNSNIILSSKATNSIDFNGDIAYLATDFGIVQIDLASQKIKELDLNLSRLGVNAPIYGSVVIGQKIMAVSDSSIIVADLSANLQNFNAWKFTKNPTGFSDKKHAIINFKNTAYLLFSGLGLFKFDNPGLVRLVDLKTGITNMAIKDNSIVMATKGKILQYDVEKKITTVLNISNLNLPQKIAIDGNKTWITDNTQGLISDISGNFKGYNPIATSGLIVTRNDSVIKEQSGLIFTKLENNSGLKVSGGNGKSKIFQTIPLLPDNSRNSNTVNSIAVDKNNTIYVAVDGGIVAVNPDPRLLESNSLAEFISTPIIGNVRTLANEIVLSIAVDGGNRKWIGTKNALYLFNEDLSEIIQKFDNVNSPLPSNYIQFLNFEPISGELFVYTNNGIVSYRTNATEGKEIQDNAVLVFPNPIRPEYSGLIGVSGLLANAFVKITDVAGKLIYQTRANGGTATWDLNSQNGTRAEAGIYYIFSGNEFGKENFVTKLVIIK